MTRRKRLPEFAARATRRCAASPCLLASSNTHSPSGVAAASSGPSAAQREQHASGFVARCTAPARTTAASGQGAPARVSPPPTPPRGDASRVRLLTYIPVRSSPARSRALHAAHSGSGTPRTKGRGERKERTTRVFHHSPLFPLPCLWGGGGCEEVRRVRKKHPALASEGPFPRATAGTGRAARGREALAAPPGAEQRGSRPRTAPSGRGRWHRRRAERGRGAKPRARAHRGETEPAERRQNVPGSGRRGAALRAIAGV